MVKNEIKDQISLFELQQPEKQEKATPDMEDGSKLKVTKKTPITDRKTQVIKKADKQFLINNSGRKAGRGKSGNGKTSPGPVPDGDVRLTANIRDDLHLKLKIIAATRRTTIGELIEELVDKHL